MNYSEARNYLSEFSMYGSVPGLGRIEQLLRYLGHPDRKLNVIHVAGTNGKGSTCAYLASILERAGYRAGRYTSPAVHDYLERFMINNTLMAEESFAAYMDVVREAIERMEANGDGVPTVFEIETALAFLYFSEADIDFLIMEAGMGGLGDATNVIEHPLMTLITPISMDHTEYLGGTIEEIALQKAGIIKGGHPVVLGPQPDGARKVIYEYYVARERSASAAGFKGGRALPSAFRVVSPADIQIFSRNLLEQCFSFRQYELSTSLLGVYQLENAATAVLAAELLQESGYIITTENIVDGIAETAWFGRFTVIDGSPVLILDGAHNQDGVHRLRESLRAYYAGKRLIFIMGVFKDKDYKGMLDEIADLCSEIYLVSLPDWGRSLIPGILKHEVSVRGLHGEVCNNYSDAAKFAARDAGPEGTVVAFGSLSYLAEMEKAWKKTILKEPI